jgi:hypothetical protein
VTPEKPAGGTSTVRGAQTRAPEVPVAGPSAKGQAKGTLAAFGAQALLSKQLQNVRSAELAKAEARFQQLAPEIERLLQEGYSVVVTVEAEVPKTLNIAGAAGRCPACLISFWRLLSSLRSLGRAWRVPSARLWRSSAFAACDIPALAGRLCFGKFIRSGM